MIEYVGIGLALFICGFVFYDALIASILRKKVESLESAARNTDRISDDYIKLMSEFQKYDTEKQKQIEIIQGISDSNAKKLKRANEQIRIQNDIIVQLRSELEKAKKNDARDPKTGRFMKAVK